MAPATVKPADVAGNVGLRIWTDVVTREVYRLLMDACQREGINPLALVEGNVAVAPEHVKRIAAAWSELERAHLALKPGRVVQTPFNPRAW